jgi:hypothetical protein
LLIPVSKLMKLRFDWIQKMAYFGLINNKNAMKFILTILIGLVSVGAFAQTTATKPSTTNCYKEWYTLFKERGTTPLADGTHEVVISIKGSDAYSECFLGKIEVKEGKMAGKLQIQKMDGSYGDFDKKATAFYTNESGQVKDELRFVNSGMSEEFTSTDGEVVRLFFYKSLAEKPKANKKAPSPSALIKN